MNLIEQALEKKSELKDLRKSCRWMIDSYCFGECNNRKSQEYKDLKKEVKRSLDLTRKARIQEQKSEEDPVSVLFAKVNDTIALLRDMGKLEELKGCLTQLNTLDVTLKDETPKVKHPIKDLEEKLADNWDEQEGISSSINDLKEKAEDDGLCSKTRFNKLVKIVQDQNAGKDDVEDKLQEEFLLSGLITKGAEMISDIINPKDKQNADTDEG